MSTEFIAYPGQGYAVSQEPGLPQQAESPWAPPQHGHSSMLCRQPLDAVRRCWDVCCERPVLVPKGAVVGHSSPWCPLSSFKLDTFWTNRGCGDHQQRASLTSPCRHCEDSLSHQVSQRNDRHLGVIVTGEISLPCHSQRRPIFDDL